MRQILLVEPAYNNKYPPLGLMKISTYHKLKGDYVQFVKGCDHTFQKRKWDRIYISTLFTFFWDITLKTIRYYQHSVNDSQNIFVGGVLATLLGDEIKRETNVRIIPGLINQPGMLDPNDRLIVDALIPDYNILQETKHKYGIEDAYLGYATRGCPNGCNFCAVRHLEPHFEHYLPIKRQVKGIEEIYGPKQDLILLDNNVLASERFDKIIADILDLGFYKGVKFKLKMRCLDFNQGLDARLLTPEKMALLAKTAIRPLRIAFDFISLKDLYVSRIKLARDNGLIHLSNYVLYNYLDTPEDFYERLKINCILNKELGTKIYSFPMKYIPLDAKDRLHVGPNWNRKILRGIQCILLVTRGMVSPRLEFFEAAFGSTPEEFIKIALMPDEYIIYRRRHENNGAYDWNVLYQGLTENQKQELLDIISVRKVKEADLKEAKSLKMRRLLEHYIEADKLAREGNKKGKNG